MPLGFYLANVCFTQKVKTFFCSCFPPAFSITSHVLFYEVLDFLKEQEGVLATALVQKQWRPSILSTKQGCRRAELCFNPATACWAPLGKLLCPVCPRDEDADTVAA